VRCRASPDQYAIKTAVLGGQYVAHEIKRAGLDIPAMMVKLLITVMLGPNGPHSIFLPTSADSFG